MKKVFKLFTMAFISMFAFVLGVNAKDMTADEVKALAGSGNTIALTEDVTLTSSLTIPSEVTVLDLGGKTLTLKKGIVVNSSLVIKNGTIIRDFTSGNMIVVNNATTDFSLEKVILDGKNVEATSNGNYGGALYVNAGKNISIYDSEIVNHKFSSIGIVYINGAENVTVGGKTKISNNETKTNAIFAVNDCGNFNFGTDAIVSNNTAKEASGIHVQNTDAVIAGTIEGNTTTKVDGNGAGLYTLLTDEKNSSGELKTVIIAETAKIINNVAQGAGGGVYVTGLYDDAVNGQVIMLGGLISGNVAKGTPADGTLKDGGGAGIYVARGNMVIEGGVIENNTSTSGIGDAILVSNAGKNTESGNLEITGGEVDGKIVRSETYGAIAVLGGAFTDDVTNYIVIGTNKAEVDGVTYVGKSYKVTLDKVEKGKVTLSTEEAVVGQPVKLTFEANKGYKVSKAVYVGADGKEVEIKDGKFIMPDEDVTVKVTFVADVKSPDTDDNAMIFMVLGLIGLVGAAVTTNKLRHN